MTQEERNLLLKDLGARLAYGVKLNIPSFSDTPQLLQQISDYETVEINDYASPIEIDEVKPYLRLMSSMTEEEFQELHSICPHSTFNKTNVPGWIVGIDGSDYGRISRIDEISKLIDWLNAHHFDYRNLIPMGLALEAPKDMYKI